MSIKYKKRDEKRKKRNRFNLKNMSSRLRLSVYRSNQNIYAQVIDDNSGKTILAAFPPSSKVKPFPVPASEDWICFPTPVEPVKAILSTP